MSPVPDSIRVSIEAALAEGGTPTTVRDASPVGGGCISPTAKLETDVGPFFLKWSGPDLPAGLLAAESRGLRALAHADEVRVPDVVAEAPEGSPWLLLEWLQPGGGGSNAWTRLGTELAALHRHRADRFGADRPNFIGSLPQENGWSDDWPAFWRERRLDPQLRQAIDSGLMDASDRRRFDSLFGSLGEILAPGQEDGPSLLHGDLWGGNVHMMAEGGAALIDPSVYHGHREVDLAMADLFGGFGADFHSAYDDAWPVLPGYHPTRRAVYQLYYLLVHVNLFGRSYVGRTRRSLEAAGF